MNVLPSPGTSGTSGKLLLGALLALGLATGAAGADNKTSKPALSVATTTAVPAEWPIRLTAGGNVTAWQEASVGAEVGGLRLTDVKVNVGDTVKRGQVLAAFSTTMVEADVAQARAALAETQAALAEAAANAERARQLSQSGAMSAQQVNQLLTAERTAQARMESARAALENQQTRLRQTRLLAPDTGVISARSATVGAVVGAGQELFRLIRDHRLEWRAEVPATELARIKAGQAVRITPRGRRHGGRPGAHGGAHGGPADAQRPRLRGPAQPRGCACRHVRARRVRPGQRAGHDPAAKRGDGA